jgi:hypothetical protein
MLILQRRYSMLTAIYETFSSTTACTSMSAAIFCGNRHWHRI